MILVSYCSFSMKLEFSCFVMFVPCGVDDLATAAVSRSVAVSREMDAG